MICPVWLSVTGFVSIFILYINKNMHNPEAELTFSEESFCVSVYKRHKRVQLGNLAHAEQRDNMIV